VYGYAVHTQLFISPTKYPELLLSYANYFYISEAHIKLKYSVLLYAYILVGAGIQRGRKCEFQYDTIPAGVPQLPRAEWENYLSRGKAFVMWR
jgi:hypothetical protein